MYLRKLRKVCNCNKEQLILINIVISNIVTDYLQKTLDFEKLKEIQANYKQMIVSFSKGIPPEVLEVFESICEWKRQVREICEKNAECETECERILLRYKKQLEKMFYNVTFIREVVCQVSEEVKMEEMKRHILAMEETFL